MSAADSPRRFPDPLEIAILLSHAGLAVAMRTIAWQEVTTPAYLMSRGLLLYRDIKFVHTPGLMAMLALAFRFFGVHGGVLRVFGIFWGLLAHFYVLKETRGGRPFSRAAASLVFLAVFFSWSGNSIWPTTILAALSLPIARDLTGGRFARAGLALGAAILCKQTAAYLLLVAGAALLWRRRGRDAARLAAFASLPYAAAAAVFGLLGGGRDFFEWTMKVPFSVLKGTVDALPNAAQILNLVLVVLPLLLAWLGGVNGAAAGAASNGWLFTVAAGFSMVAYPRYSYLNLLGATPLFAVGFERALRLPGLWARRLATGMAATTLFSGAALLAAGEEFDGRITRWNEDPVFNDLVDRLRAEPPGRPVDVHIAGNLLPRSLSMPPGGLYVSPAESHYFPVDRIADRISEAAARSRAIEVVWWSPGLAGERVGPYVIRR